MSKTNYINYQEVLKDGDYCKINSYGKKENKTKKLLKSIWSFMKKIPLVKLLYGLLVAILLVLMLILVIMVFGGILMLFFNFIIGGIMLGSSLAVVLFALLIGFIMIKLENYI